MESGAGGGRAAVYLAYRRETARGHCPTCGEETLLVPVTWKPVEVWVFLVPGPRPDWARSRGLSAAAMNLTYARPVFLEPDGVKPVMGSGPTEREAVAAVRAAWRAWCRSSKAVLPVDPVWEVIP